MVLVSDIKNPWGRAIANGDGLNPQGRGLNPQRTDLWQADLTQALAGLHAVPKMAATFDFTLEPYYLVSFSLPEQKVKAEVVRRDSRSYQMPSWDEPLEAAKIVFIFDDGDRRLQGASYAASRVLEILTAWRAVVRAGRGAVGANSAEIAMPLDKHYRIDYRFPITLRLYRGPERVRSAPVGVATVRPINDGQAATFDVPVNAEQSGAATQRTAKTRSQLPFDVNDAGLELGAGLLLENAWLGGFKIGDLSYEGAKVLTIEATFYIENIIPMSGRPDPRPTSKPASK